jgi:NitT/TauT family transport system permease protein
MRASDMTARQIAFPWAMLAIGTMAAFGVWYLASNYEVRGLGPEIRPWRVVARLWQFMSDPIFQQDYRASFFRVMFATTGGMAAALVMGICVGNWNTIDLLTRPLLYTLQSIPIIVLGLIFLLVIGPTYGGSVAFVGTAVGLSTTPMVASAVRQVEENHLRIARAMGMRPLQRIFEIVLPSILPALFDSLRAALVTAWSFMAFAEVMGGDYGLGLRINEHQRYDHATDTFAYVIAITGTIILIDLLLRFLKPRLCPWLRRAAA